MCKLGSRTHSYVSIVYELGKRQSYRSGNCKKLLTSFPNVFGILITIFKCRTVRLDSEPFYFHGANRWLWGTTGAVEMKNSRTLQLKFKEISKINTLDYRRKLLKCFFSINVLVMWELALTNFKTKNRKKLTKTTRVEYFLWNT